MGTPSLKNSAIPEDTETKESFDQNLHYWKGLTFRLNIYENDENDLSSFLKKPGECVNKLFEIPEKFSSGNFNSNDYDENTVPNLSEKQIFKNEKINDACYMYNLNYKNNYEILVISARGENEGWVWMMSSKPKSENSNFKDLFYRELILEKVNGKWKVTLGQEGEIKHSDSHSTEITLKKENNFLENINQKWIDAHIQFECSASENNCKSEQYPWKSLNLYWKPNKTSQKKLSELSSNTNNQIIRWSEKKEEIYNGDNRKRVYWNGKWHSKLDVYKNKPLIKLENENLADLKGEWKNLFDICEADKETFNSKNPSPDKEKQTYCFYKYSTFTFEKDQTKEIENKLKEIEISPENITPSKDKTQTVSKKEDVRKTSPEVISKEGGGDDENAKKSQFPQEQENETYIKPNEKEQTSHESPLPPVVKKKDPITYRLDFKEDNYYESFNKPGICITKLFKNINEDPLFTNYANPEKSKLNLNDKPKEVFKGNNKLNKIKTACFSYHFKNKENKIYQRLEIGVIGEKEGWVWMMASKPHEEGNAFRLYYREFNLKNNGGKWNVTFGQEGEIKDTAGKPDTFKSAYGFWDKGHNKWYDLVRGNNCPDENCNSSSEKSIYLYWIPVKNSLKMLVELAGNTGDLILRWGGDARKQIIYSKSFEWKDNGSYETFDNRRRVYYDGKWHNNLGIYANQQLIKLDDKDVAKTNGEWKSLIGFCVDDKSKNESKTYYDIFCNKNIN